jgi:hypothetical protein
MNLATFHFKKLTFFSLLSFADLFLTYQLVQKTGGGVYESNPIANAWLSSYGWVGLVVFKVIAMSVLMCAAMLLALHRPHVAGEVLVFACFAVGGVVLYSGVLMNRMRAAEARHREAVGPVIVCTQNTGTPVPGALLAKYTKNRPQRLTAPGMIVLADNSSAGLVSNTSAPARTKNESRVSPLPVGLGK